MDNLNKWFSNIIHVPQVEGKRGELKSIKETTTQTEFSEVKIRNVYFTLRKLTTEHVLDSLFHACAVVEVTPAKR